MEVSVYGKKVIKRDIYQIIIPMILENILQISANLVITAMVGRLLANDISAQGICIRVTDTLWCFYKGVAIGATVLIARAYGAGRHQDCRKIAEQTILTEMIILFIFQYFPSIQEHICTQHAMYIDGCNDFLKLHIHY